MTVGLVWANWLTIAGRRTRQKRREATALKAPASEGGRYRFKGKRAD